MLVLVNCRLTRSVTTANIIALARVRSTRGGLEITNVCKIRNEMFLLKVLKSRVLEMLHSESTVSTTCNLLDGDGALHQDTGKPPSDHLSWSKMRLGEFDQCHTQVQTFFNVCVVMASKIRGHV